MSKNIDNQDPKHSLFWIMKKNLFSIPISVRIISFSSFLFILGRGLGADTFFSLYIKSIIDNIFWVAIIGGGLSAIRLIFTIPIGNLDDHANMKSIIFLSKFFYVIAGILYFVAGSFDSMSLLILAVIFNGIASASLFTTYQSYIRHWIRKNQGGSAFGLFFSSFNFAYVIGALISATFIAYIDIKYVFLFVSLFAVISFFTDKQLPELKAQKKLHLFHKESFLHQFFREIFNFKTFKETYIIIKNSNKGIRKGLMFELFFGALNYIGFLFIPIIAAQKNLSLANIAIIFAIMRAPYIIDLVLGAYANRLDKKLFIMTVLLFTSFLYILLAYTSNFVGIITISFGISLGLALIRPMISAIISDHGNKNIFGAITGAEQFAGRLGDVIGAFGFGILSTILGIKIAFVIVGVLLFVTNAYYLIKKFLSLKKITTNENDLTFE